MPKHGIYPTTVLQKVIRTIGVTVALLLVTGPGPALAATFYVSRTGSDTNSGSQAQPWFTIQKAANSVSAGDTVLVEPGIYDERVSFLRSGATNAPIIFRADGAVTNKGTLWIRAAWITVDGFELTASSTNVYYSAITFGVSGVSNCQIINNKIHDTPDIYPFGALSFENSGGTNSTTNVTVSNNYIYNIRGIMIALNGVNHLVVNNWMSNSFGSDAFGVWGRGHIIRGNFCTQIGSQFGSVEHPDFIQTFGPLVNPATPMWGLISYDIVVEQNQVINCPGGAIAQLECNNGTNPPPIHHWTFRNNIFANIDLGASIDIPNCHWYNNTFFHCVPNASCLSFSWYDPAGTDPRGQPYGASVYNNAFVACGYSNQTGWYAGSTAGSFVPIPPIDLYTNCDYNFVCSPTFGPKPAATQYPSIDPFKFFEPHGINGGDPLLESIASNNFRLKPNSPLIDKGKPIGEFNNDFGSLTRPQGPFWDIGAFEFPSGSRPTPPSNLRIQQ